LAEASLLPLVASVFFLVSPLLCSKGRPAEFRAPTLPPLPKEVFASPSLQPFATIRLRFSFAKALFGAVILRAASSTAPISQILGPEEVLSARRKPVGKDYGCSLKPKGLPAGRRG
jgi:hypothetical protein